MAAVKIGYSILVAGKQPKRQRASNGCREYYAKIRFCVNKKGESKTLGGVWIYRALWIILWFTMTQENWLVCFHAEQE
ncbi:hypothetical protein TPSD3_05445 [Thioflexithrix psekupsensis]|uniref:Uncharacterized protein n=1 Tax=Thioflexithrix psekupsensis TaxID=1570016 RepID=A0A251X6U5_9GAMM|nr:hypothetical protein TPSD3_05445 [Thioflexithrix psekupsensis]